MTVGGIEGIKTLVNGLLARLIRNQFLEYWIIPAWHNTYLPMMVPPPEVVLQRMGIQVKTTTSTSSSSSSSMRASSESNAKDRPLSAHSATSLAHQNRPSTLAALRTRNWSNSTPNGDALFGRAFAHSTIVPDDIPGVEVLEKGLLNGFLSLALEVDRPGSTAGHTEGSSGTVTLNATPIASDIPLDGSQAPPSTTLPQLSDEWKTVRQSKNDVKVQKKRLVVNGKLCEISRGLVRISCDADRVYSVRINAFHIMLVNQSGAHD